MGSGTGLQVCRVKVPERPPCMELSSKRRVYGRMQKLPSILLSFLLAWHFALAGGVCACFETDDHRAQDSQAGQDPASLDASQQPSGVVTASLAHPHDDRDKCNHTALGTADLPAVAKRGKSPAPTVPALNCSADTPWTATGDTDVPSIAGSSDCEHHWLRCSRSIVLRL